MENNIFGGQVILELENLISESCPELKVPQKFEDLHIALLKKHYNAADVSIDYHRKRVYTKLLKSFRNNDAVLVA